MVGGGSLVLKVGGVIALTVAVAVALAVVLAFFKFDQKLIAVTGGRLGVVADEVRRQAEVGLALGLDIAELDDLQGVVERAARARGIARVFIADAGGEIRYSSLPAMVGGRLDVPLTDTGDGSHLGHVTADRIVVAAPLRNGFGHTAGTVAVTAMLTAQRAEEDRVRAELISSAAPVIAVALAVTLLAVMLTVRWSVGTAAPSAAAVIDAEDDEESAQVALAATAKMLHETVEPRMAAAVLRAEKALDGVAAELGLETPEGSRGASS